MNERADGLMEQGYYESVWEVCSAPQKYGSLWLVVQPHVRALAAQHQKSLPSLESEPPKKSNQS